MMHILATMFLWTFYGKVVMFFKAWIYNTLSPFLYILVPSSSSNASLTFYFLSLFCLIYLMKPLTLSMSNNNSDSFLKHQYSQSQ